MSDNFKHEVAVPEENHGDEPLSNHSNNRRFADMVAERVSRREVIAGSIGRATVVVMDAHAEGG